MLLPKISIVTPCYNQYAFLEATIDSVLSQGYPNLEYVVVDGGSTDGSQKIIRKYNRYLHYWCSERDKGQYDAINKGFSFTSGHIMAWINGDDMYYPWALRTVGEIMGQFAEVEWLTTSELGAWDEEGLCTGFFHVPVYSRDAYYEGRYLPLVNSSTIGAIQQESTFWKRELWSRAGAYVREDLQYAGDFELWGRFFGLTNLYATDIPIGGFRYRSGQKTEQIGLYNREAVSILQEIRIGSGWRVNNIRKWLRRMGAKKWPFLRRYVERYFGYVGYRVVRRKPGESGKRWEVVREKAFQ